MTGTGQSVPSLGRCRICPVSRKTSLYDKKVRRPFLPQGRLGRDAPGEYLAESRRVHTSHRQRQDHRHAMPHPTPRPRIRHRSQHRQNRGPVPSRPSAAANRWQNTGSTGDDDAAGMVPRSDQAGVRTAMINSWAMPVPLPAHTGVSPVLSPPRLCRTPGRLVLSNSPS
jgi:hypothetical protein